MGICRRTFLLGTIATSVAVGVPSASIVDIPLPITALPVDPDWAAFLTYYDAEQKVIRRVTIRAIEFYL